MLVGFFEREDLNTLKKKKKKEFSLGKNSLPDTLGDEIQGWDTVFQGHSAEE